ncbi:unnamed protein product [Rangifer tarandus platyrhynchus]|uniref:Uncharacterized protein n=1 Tax=Rangifer tarandus platyrhynchus TaxID=3082113 RepID=A0AC59ZJ59_RANTA
MTRKFVKRSIFLKYCLNKLHFTKKKKKERNSRKTWQNDLLNIYSYFPCQLRKCINLVIYQYIAPVFLTGKSNGQRSLAGYSPGGRKRARHSFETKQQQHITI